MCNVYKFEVGKKYTNHYGKVVCCVAKSGFEDGQLVLEMETGGCYKEKAGNVHLYKEYVPPPKVHEVYIYFADFKGIVSLEHSDSLESAWDRRKFQIERGYECGEIQKISGTTR